MLSFQKPLNKKQYSDFSANLDINPISGDLLVVYDDDAVKKSLGNIVRTYVSERPFNMTTGSSIARLLFENYSPAIQQSVETELRRVLELFEPRASIISISLSTSETTVSSRRYRDNPEEFIGEVVITIVFSLLNKYEPISVNVILTRVR